MRKIVIACTLVLAVAGAASGQDLPTPADIWLNRSDLERAMWAAGFQDGLLLCCHKERMSAGDGNDAILDCRNKTWRKISDIMDILQIMTNMYQDRANCHVPPNILFTAAEMKLQGGDHEAFLENARAVFFPKSKAP